VLDAEEAAVWAAVPAERLVSGPAPRESQAVLWTPSPLARILVGMLRNKEEAAAPRLAILDVGAGTGRNAVFIATALGAEVTCVEQRGAMVQKLVKFAARQGLSERITPVQADVMAFLEGAAPAFHVAAFFRTTNKGAMAAALSVLTPWSGPDGCAFVVVEGFHVSSPHPTSRSSTLEEGEVESLVRGGAAPEWVVHTLHEALVQAEDGRPLLQVILRATRHSPSLTPSP
jgi:SAM-dependent methyltransferase